MDEQLKKQLAQIRVEAEEVAGNWNGKEDGRGEYRASCANELVDAIDALTDLLNEFYA